MLSPESWFVISSLVGGICAVLSIGCVVYVVRAEMRRVREDEEAPETPLRDAMSRDGETGV